ncbi:hypothetical protein FIBSPDRAFT_1048969, partial [Athelia psychrophila]
MSLLPGETPSENQVIISRSLSELVQEAVAPLKEPGPPDSDIHYWIQEANSSVERAKTLHAKGSKDESFMNFAKAAVILRAKLPGLPGYAQLSIDRKHSIALTVYETFSYIHQYHTDILTRTPPYDTFPNPDIDESQSARQEQTESHEESAAWVYLNTIINYEEGSREKNLSGFDQIPGHSYERHLGYEDSILPVPSSGTPFLPPAYAIIPPLERRLKNVDGNASIPEEPRSPLVDPGSIKDDRKSPISMLIPEIPPEPISLFLDLYPLEDAHLIPDFSPSKLEFTLNEERADPKIV